jgi:hypothetical protein
VHILCTFQLLDICKSSYAQFLLKFAAVANGLQNGVTSTYSANLIRTSHLTGTSTDIGLIFGQMLRGNWKHFWKFKVLCSLAFCFWLGSLVSYYSASTFLGRSLWFSASLYLIIGFSHVTFVALTKKVSLVQACVGNWNWDKVLDKIADSMCQSQDASGVDKKVLLSQNVDDIFDQVDADGSGTYRAPIISIVFIDELKGLDSAFKEKLTVMSCPPH